MDNSVNLGKHSPNQRSPRLEKTEQPDSGDLNANIRTTPKKQLLNYLKEKRNA